MVLTDLLQGNRAALLSRWTQLIVESYPADSSGFLEREKDRFLNPVGYTISTETENLFQQLLGAMEVEALALALDNIVQIRAVQEFSPSQAIGFVFLLKKAVRELPEVAGGERELLGQLLEFESRIDRLALLAFDLYAKRREKIYQIRTRELRERSGRILDRMNRLYGWNDQEAEDPERGSSDVMRGSVR